MSRYYWLPLLYKSVLIYNFVELACLTFFTAGVVEADPLKVGLTRGANKNWEFGNKCSNDKRKLIASSPGMQVEDLFPNYLDESRGMAIYKANNMSGVPKVPRIKRIKN